MTQLMRDFDDYTGGIVSKNERLEEENGELKEKHGTLEERNETLEDQKHESMLRLIAFLLQSGYSESEAQAEAKKIFG